MKRLRIWWRNRHPWHAIAEHQTGLGIDMGTYTTHHRAQIRAAEDCPPGGEWSWRVIHTNDLNGR